MYPTGTGSNIGELLRLIQEQKNSSLAAVPPAAQPESPIRGIVQQPLQAPESPTSSRVVSVRPEGVTQQEPQSGQVIAAGESVPGGVIGPVVPPKASVAPVVSPQSIPASSGGAPAP